MRKRIMVMFLVLIACDDVVEKDISKSSVNIRTPADGSSVKAQTDVQFWWDQVSGATQYELTIATPDFDNPVRLVTDSLLEKNLVTLKLDTGKYHWCVSAINYAYQTPNSCRLLHVIP